MGENIRTAHWASVDEGQHEWFVDAALRTNERFMGSSHARRVPFEEGHKHPVTVSVANVRAGEKGVSNGTPFLVGCTSVRPCVFVQDFFLGMGITFLGLPLERNCKKRNFDRGDFRNSIKK